MRHLSRLKSIFTTFVIVMSINTVFMYNKAVASSPTITMKFKDGAQASHFMANNPWMKDYYGSNLYRGLNYRIGPVFSSLGSVYSEAWTGRLMDFIVSNVLSKNPIEFGYYTQGNLASPFLIKVKNITDTQKTLIGKVVRQIGVRDGSVFRVKVARQNFALGISGTCVVISRDAGLAKQNVGRCKKKEKEQLNDLNFEIRAANFSPNTFSFVRKTFGMTGLLRLSFNYDKEAAQFVPSHADVGLKKKNLVRESDTNFSFAEALPLDTFFVSTVAVPSPSKMSDEGIGEYLAQIEANKPPKEAMNVSIGVLVEDNKIETALLFQREKGKETQEDFLKLFSETSLVEAKFSYICDTWVVTESSTVLKRIASTCSGKQPSFKSNSDRIMNSYFKSKSSMSVYLNMGTMLAKFSSMGWKSLHPDETEPEALKKTQSLLARIPAVAMSGVKENNKLRLAR